MGASPERTHNPYRLQAALYCAAGRQANPVGNVAGAVLAQGSANEHGQISAVVLSNEGRAAEAAPASAVSSVVAAGGFQRGDPLPARDIVLPLLGQVFPGRRHLGEHGFMFGIERAACEHPAFVGVRVVFGCFLHCRRGNGSGEIRFRLKLGPALNGDAAKSF